MKNKEFNINSYDFSRSNRLGLECLGAHVFEFELIDEIKSYSFSVELEFAKNRIDRLLKEDILIEPISGTYTGSLKEFECTYTLPKFIRDKGDNGKRKGFDWFKFLEKVCPENLEFAKIRLLRKRDNKIPPIVIYNEGGNGFRVNNEFLEFDENSAFNWAGPFKCNEKLGCIMIYGENKHKADYPTFNVKKEHNFYSIPYNTRDTLKLTANDHWELNSDEKEALFNSLSTKDQYETAKAFFKIVNNYLNEYLACTQPYTIYLAGTDDCSYTKYFSSEEEMNEELKYLRMMQPLNFYVDIRMKDYIFTN